MRYWILPALAALAACGAPAPTADRGNTADAAAAIAPAKNTPLTIETKGGVRPFSVELAVSEAEQEQGLMFRKTLPSGTGMLFPFNPPRAPSFWMKNTVIPLDMVFVAPDGRIAAIFANREPYSLEPTSIGAPMIAVLEIAGGEAAKLGLAQGDQLRWGTCAAPAPGPRWDGTAFCP